MIFIKSKQHLFIIFFYSHIGPPNVLRLTNVRKKLAAILHQLIYGTLSEDDISMGLALKFESL